jgi:methionyl aminopeptidase
MDRNDPCFCGSGKKWKKCHAPELPSETFEDKKQRYRKQYGIILKTPKEIAGIKKASQIAAFILDELCKMAKAGVTTNQLNEHAELLHKQHKAIAAPKGYGYPPFPKSICTSLNEVICHGIPNDVPLKDGDIMNIDVTSIVDGYYGDCSRMVTIGHISKEARHLVDVTEECLNRAIACVKPGVLISKIGDVIESYAHAKGCSVVHQFVAHGVGCDFHEPPQIPHNKNDVHIPMEVGMTFTIEPMINLGDREGIIDHHDKWTARTVDGKLSAQCEHTIVVTETGCEILTTLS